ncbi:MAG: membrane protein FxsA [Desulfobacteraceae bacterium 4572_130]|nr:MAG: membrane protein FxsA [Desulfobacteraceae bacterium 4572_130]
MFLKLFICFMFIPVIELYFLIKIGTVIGSFNTILIIIVTGFFGAWLARMEGIQTTLKIKENLQKGIMPTQEVLDALIIFIAGIVLITPGFLTDLAGFLLLFPLTRNKFKIFMIKQINKMKLNDNIIDITNSK